MLLKNVNDITVEKLVGYLNRISVGFWKGESRTCFTLEHKFKIWSHIQIIETYVYKQIYMYQLFTDLNVL